MIQQEVLDEIVREMGFTKLKPKHLEAIVAVASGNDTLVSLPMVYSKSVVVMQSPRSYLRAVESYGRSLLLLLEL